MGKGTLSFRRRRTKKQRDTPLLSAPADAAGDTPSPNNGANNSNSISAMVAGSSKPKKKAGGARLWMRFDKLGQSEVIECEKSTIIKRVSIPTRDLRILLGPVFSHSSNILAREKAMIVNLEFIKAIVTAEEVLLLDPLRQEVLPFVDQLRLQLAQKSPPKIDGAGQLAGHENEHLTTPGQWLPIPEAVEGLQSELPFEFQVLEIALEVVCTYLDSSVADLERDAYPVLDELARSVSTKNLEHVRSLKSNLTRLLARVQKAIQRSRVRKLQYIAELERNVQALQAEGSEVSAELEFLNQQNLILSMENKALKQRLENVAQEQLIKYLEHEVLEREIGRLRALYQQQQQPPQQKLPSSSHRR